MSRITGGIFSRPSGSTGGLVFGAARSRIGKVVTIREKVDPTNPNTAAQQTQRTIFSECLTIVRTLGSVIYQVGWNRSIGQLPGFQSLMSVMMTQMNSAFELILTLAINLGILHVPTTVTVTSPAAGNITIDWTGELGANGTANDQVVILFLPKDQAVRAVTGSITSVTSKVRSDLTYNTSSYSSGDTIYIYFYLLGAGTAAGLRSIANPLAIVVS